MFDMPTQKCTPVSSWMISTSTSWCRDVGVTGKDCVSAAALSPAVAQPPAPLSSSVPVCAHGKMELSHSKWNRVVSEWRYEVSIVTCFLPIEAFATRINIFAQQKKMIANLITCFLMKLLIIWFTQWYQTKWWSHRFSIIDLQFRGHLCSSEVTFVS